MVNKAEELAEIREGLNDGAVRTIRPHEDGPSFVPAVKSEDAIKMADA